MGIEKAEIKMAVAHDIGCSLDDMLTAARAEIHRWEGAKLAHQQAQGGIDSLMGIHLKKDLEEGNLGMEEAEKIQRWLQRARGVNENLALQSDAMICKAKGKVEAMEKAVLVTKKVYDTEERKKNAVDEPGEPDERLAGRPTRAVGSHPGQSVAQQRRDEAQETVEKPAKKTKRKCGKCGEPGHTARTCKKKKTKKS